MAGQQFDYAFDDIGNRESATRDGRQSTYAANLLNQYSSRTVPGYVNVLGEATNDATVTVNLQPSTRHSNYFRVELAVTNTSPLWLGLTNIAVLNQGTNADLISTNIGNLLLAQASEGFTFDADGNLTSDSLWTNVWNAENRRTNIESRSNVPTGGKVREQWTYLPDGRWVQRIVSTNNGSSYVVMQTNRYVWDGNVLLAVLNHTNGLELAFMRGLDLSGSLQGAGGVGGLLGVKVGPAGPTGLANTTHFAAYDGNGNVAALVNAADGVESARYEYGPFAEPLRITGVMGKVNPIRFSTQYADDFTGDTKYLYRDYRADTGRWLNRDPIGEKGGLNLAAFVKNEPLRSVDRLGLNRLVESHIGDLVRFGGLAYSCNCGWIDGPHLSVGYEQAKSIMIGLAEYDNRVDGQLQPPFVLDMTGGFWAGMFGAYSPTYQQSLSQTDRAGTVISILMSFAAGYERAQDRWWLPPSMDSGFSVEDMPSYFLGALIALEETMPGTGLSFDQIRSKCGVLGANDSKRMLRCGSGPTRNEGHKPMLWSWRGWSYETRWVRDMDGARHREFFACPCGKDPCEGKSGGKVKDEIDKLFDKYDPSKFKNNYSVDMEIEWSYWLAL